ncbi:UNVERIFIED_CONTAM: GNAT family N-acetyltransferase [Halobacillus marinus]|uniref:GNAT family N-acetyltransferase n=1 Tax=Halobacillus sp. BAB-2008 TaxID=1246484 RepID=UPI000587B2F5|nr:GNAT family N-acetyltransferase [Halobacillus sp. BAB-2008]
MKVKELVSKQEIIAAFPVMKQLRTHLTESAYLDLVTEAQRVDRYRLFAWMEDEKIVAVAGVKPMTTLYYGRFVWVCDLVTDEKHRSKGCGEKLLNAVHHWAVGEGYESVALSSGLQRKDAHRFYMDKMGYDQVSFVFKKTL